MYNIFIYLYIYTGKVVDRQLTWCALASFEESKLDRLVILIHFFHVPLSWPSSSCSSAQFLSPVIFFRMYIVQHREFSPASPTISRPRRYEAQLSRRSSPILPVSISQNVSDVAHLCGQVVYKRAKVRGDEMRREKRSIGRRIFYGESESAFERVLFFIQAPIDTDRLIERLTGES